MKRITTFLVTLAMVLAISSCRISSKNTTAGAETGYQDESQKPLSYFNIYRGNSHSHTIFTWTHGAHRKEPIKELDKPTPFAPKFPVPRGTDWRDEKTINTDPAEYPVLQGLPANHLALAKEHGYDFYAITDHCQEPALNPVSPENPAWKNILQAVDKYDNDPEFAAIAGIEFSRNTDADGGNGHINVLNGAEYINADHGQRGPALPWPGANWSIPKFYGWVKAGVKPHSQGPVVVGFNHPSIKQFGDWANIDSEIIKHIATFELHTNYNEMRWKAYLHALNKGWKVSPIGVHDNHGYAAILDPEKFPPTIVLAPKLTREEILKGMAARRTFVTYIENVGIKYAVNGCIMGSTLKKDDKFSFNIEITTPSEPGSMARKVQVVRDHPDGSDNVEVVAEALYDGSKEFISWKPVIKDSSAKYFIVRVFHARDMKNDGTFKNNPSTVAAPVWIENIH